jgi:hypothetical protein
MTVFFRQWMSYKSNCSTKFVRKMPNDAALLFICISDANILPWVSIAMISVTRGLTSWLTIDEKTCDDYQCILWKLLDPIQVSSIFMILLPSISKLSINLAYSIRKTKLLALLVHLETRSVFENFIPRLSLRTSFTLNNDGSSLP